MRRKILILTALCLICCVACKNRGHNHSHDHHDHDHTHEQHDHHDHDHSEGHGHGHGHAHETRENQDEIVLSAEMAEAAGVKVQTIERGNFQTAVRCSGLLSPAGKEFSNISSKSSGILEWKSGTPALGQSVRASEVLGWVSTSGMGEDDALTKARIAYESSKKAYERAGTLREENIISEKEFTSIEAEFNLAENTWKSFNSEGKGVSISSPLRGYVTQVFKAQGEYVSTGEVIAAVASDRNLRLTADLPVKYASMLNSIAGVNFKSEYSESTISLSGSEARPVSSGKALSSGSTYIPVNFEFENNLGLIPGSYVDIWLLGETREDVIAVPEQALIEEQGEFYVFTQLDKDCYKKVPVNIGGRNGIYVEILSGLFGGEDVVVKGAYRVKVSSSTSVIPGHSHSH